MTREEHLYTCLMEECAEVIKEVSKILRFGAEDSPPREDLRPNTERLSDELIDVFAVLELLRQEGLELLIFDDDPKSDDLSEQKMIAKKEKVEKYINYAREKGTLTE